MSFLDPDWSRLLADADIDDAWLEWQMRQDRLQDHTPSRGASAAHAAGPAITGKEMASDHGPVTCSRPAEELPPTPRVEASPSAAGLFLLPPSPAAPSSPKGLA